MKSSDSNVRVLGQASKQRVTELGKQYTVIKNKWLTGEWLGFHVRAQQMNLVVSEAQADTINMSNCNHMSLSICWKQYTCLVEGD